MSDVAHEWTDDKIREMQVRFHEAYVQAANEMQDYLDENLRDFAEQNIAWRDRVRSGSATESQYKQWLEGRAMDIEWQKAMVERLASDATNADRLAMDAINDSLPTVYAENANYMAYDIDSKIGRDTEFTLYDTDTVRNLVVNDPTLYPRARIDVQKDLMWNRRRMSGAVTQGILRGESVPKIAQRLADVLSVDERTATRAARTATTAAENLGRMSSIRRAKDMGVELEQLWIATLDSRTRHTHRELDMQHVAVGSSFVTSSGVELRCPGDPSCKEAGEVYNCRCTLGVWTPRMDLKNAERWSKLSRGITYEEWKASKEGRDVA